VTSSQTDDIPRALIIAGPNTEESIMANVMLVAGQRENGEFDTLEFCISSCHARPRGGS